MLLEMHCHTREHSNCSQVAAVELVQRIYAKGLQGLVLTDHHYLWPAQELHDLRRTASVPEHFLILSGQEVNTPEMGDVLIYGADVVLKKGTSLAHIRERFPQAALIWAHPYRKGRRPRPSKLNSTLIDGVEIFNSNQSVRENSLGLQDWHRNRFTAIAGTDTHGPDYAGLYPTLFDHPIETVTELALEIRVGRCRPFVKEIPKAGTKSRVTEVTIGAKGMDEVRERIIIRTLDTHYKWRSARRAHHILEELTANHFDDGLFRVPRPIDQNPGSRTLIQQGLRGKSLYDKLLGSTTKDGLYFFQLAARWLAKLHNCRLCVTPKTEFWSREPSRLARYVGRFSAIQHPHTSRVEAVREVLLERERELMTAGQDGFVQGHGDFHPKNIIIGQDNLDNRDTQFVAAIDFESSLCLPPAFDVGCFLAQFRNQFYNHPHILEAFPENIFLDSYLAASGPLGEDFMEQVQLFRARTNLSIAAYLIKVGMGNSADLWRVLLEAEQALSLLLGNQFQSRARNVLRDNDTLSGKASWLPNED